MSNFVEFAKSFGGYLLSKNLVHMIVHVTNHCNFRCKHCFIDFSPKRDLKLDQYRTLGRDSGRLFWLDIGGGEPFLRKDLADIVASFDTKVVQIPSNGSLPDQMEEQITRMLAPTDREIIISLSLDGLEETHNRIRGEADSWNQVWSTFERLRRIDGLSVKILTVLQDGNADEIIPLMHEVRKRDPDYHSVILVRGEPMDENVALPPMETLRRLGAEIFKIQESYDYGRNSVAAHVLRNFHRYVWNVSLRTLEERRQVIPCLAGQSQLVGDLGRQTLAEIRGSAEYRQQVKDIVGGKCHCTHNCAMMDSIFFNPRNIPKLIRQTVE